jgi:hypothetical protein
MNVVLFVLLVEARFTDTHRGVIDDDAFAVRVVRRNHKRFKVAFPDVEYSDSFAFSIPLLVLSLTQGDIPNV